MVWAWSPTGKLSIWWTISCNLELIYDIFLLDFISSYWFYGEKENGAYILREVCPFFLKNWSVFYLESPFSGRCLTVLANVKCYFWPAKN